MVCVRRGGEGVMQRRGGGGGLYSLTGINTVTDL